MNHLKIDGKKFKLTVSVPHTFNGAEFYLNVEHSIVHKSYEVMKEQN